MEIKIFREEKQIFVLNEQTFHLSMLQLLPEHFLANSLFHAEESIKINDQIYFLIERMTYIDQVTNRTRYVFYKVHEKSFFLGPWVSFANIKLDLHPKNLGAERQQNSVLLSVFKNVFGSNDKTNRLPLKILIKRHHQNFSCDMDLEKEIFQQAFLCVDQLESFSTLNQVKISASYYIISEEPGPVVTKIDKNKIQKISLLIQRSPSLYRVEIKFFNDKVATLALPAINANSLLNDLHAHFKVSPNSIYQYINSKTDGEILLWSKVSIHELIIKFNPKQTLSFSDFQSGLMLVSDDKTSQIPYQNLLSWNDSLECLLEKNLIQSFSRDNQWIYKTTGPVQIGPFIFPCLWTYPINLENSKWIPSFWTFEFVTSDASFDRSILEKLFAPLMPLPEDREDDDFCFDLKDYTFHFYKNGGTHFFKLKLSHDRYWSLMRSSHVFSLSLVFEQVDSITFSSEEYLVADFIVHQFKSAELIPTPAPYHLIPLTIWIDRNKNLQGISHFHKCYFYPIDEVQSCEIIYASFLGDRNDLSEYHQLNINFKTQGTLSISFNRLLETKESDQILEKIKGQTGTF